MKRIYDVAGKGAAQRIGKRFSSSIASPFYVPILTVKSRFMHMFFRLKWGLGEQM